MLKKEPSYWLIKSGQCPFLLLQQRVYTYSQNFILNSFELFYGTKKKKLNRVLTNN
jgi:hypothetical protein